jgi:hypothetical protein
MQHALSFKELQKELQSTIHDSERDAALARSESVTMAVIFADGHYSNGFFCHFGNASC